MTMLKTGAVNHVTLTVTDMDRARGFCEEVLGFEFVMKFGPKYLPSKGELILGLNLPPDPHQAIPDDRFSGNRVGLDHISFNVDSLEVLQNAEQWFEDDGIPHGEIKDLNEPGLYVLAFRDPDNIQLELTAQKP